MDIAQQFISRFDTFSFSEYCSSGALEWSVVATTIFGTITWVLTITTREYSWVDRVWSLIPIFYNVHFVYHQSRCTDIPVNTRQLVMVGLISLWGLRLTYNFFRKGGYAKGGQDYRWKYIRQNYHWILVELLNFFFTAYYQLYLILWFSSPVINSYQTEFNLNDILIAGLWLILFAGEVVADQTQWNYQTEKYRLIAQLKGKNQELPQKYKRGFVKQGIFRFSRHPNFFCEIMLWYTIYLFSVNSMGWNLSGIGAVLLNLLFLGSTRLTEQISIEKYPQYLVYQKETNMLIPMPQRVVGKQQ